MLICKKYIENKIDKAWFDSSNVIYGECDESNNEYKTVRIVFKNGSCYEYKNVHVSDWTSFKNADSQGKSLNQHFKLPKYEYVRLENKDVDSILSEMKEIIEENKDSMETHMEVSETDNTILSEEDILNNIENLSKI